MILRRSEGNVGDVACAVGRDAWRALPGRFSVKNADAAAARREAPPYGRIVSRVFTEVGGRGAAVGAVVGGGAPIVDHTFVEGGSTDGGDLRNAGRHIHGEASGGGDGATVIAAGRAAISGEGL